MIEGNVVLLHVVDGGGIAASALVAFEKVLMLKASPSQPTCHKVGAWPSAIQQEADDNLSCLAEALPGDNKQCQAAEVYCRLIVTVCVWLRRLFQAFCLMCTCIWVLHSALALHPAMSPAYSSSPLSLLQIITSLSLTALHLSLCIY